MFCRHNRLTGRCPICAREEEAQRPKPAGRAPSSRTASSRSTGSSRGPAASKSSSTSGRRSSTRMVTRKLARAEDDGYRNPLVPGLKATADAERLAAALAWSAERLRPPGPYQPLTEIDDTDDALWLAFLLALVGPDAVERQATLVEERPPWTAAAPAILTSSESKTAAAFRAWAARSGTPAAAFEGEPAWDAERRFARLFERLALPGFSRAQRYELLCAVGAAELYPLTADALRVDGDDDPATLAAKRLLVSGDRMLLERRARDLVSACDVPIAALDRALVLWAAPATPVPSVDEVPAPIRRALRLP